VETRKLHQAMGATSPTNTMRHTNIVWTTPMQKQRITPKNRRRDGPTGQLPHDIDMHLPHNATRRTTSHGSPQGTAKKKSVRWTQE
jgi:hypothetical protein